MAQYSSPVALAGQVILVAEDEPLIAFDIEQTLRRSGADVVLASTLDESLLAARRAGVTCGVLDILLGQETVEPVCSNFHGRGVPFLFVTGLATSIDRSWRHIPTLMKPIDAALLVQRVIGLLTEEDRSSELLPNELLEVQRELLCIETRIERQRQLLLRMKTAGKKLMAAQRLLCSMERSRDAIQSQRNRLARQRWMGG